MRVFSVCFVLCFAFAQTVSGGKAQDSSAKDFKLSVDVDLVIFNVTVTDAKGRSVKGLSKSDFRIIEAG